METRVKIRESLFKHNKISQLKKQRTAPLEIIQQGIGEKVTIKNWVQNVKIKQRAHRWVSALSSSRRMKNLRKAQYQQINDKSHNISGNFASSESHNIKRLVNEQEDISEDENDENFPESNQIQNVFLHKSQLISYLRQFTQMIRNTLQVLPVIDPNARFKLFWDTLQGILILTINVVLPIQLAIQDYHLSYFLGSSLSLVVIIILLVSDIFINLNTGFFHRGQIQLNRSMIFQSYMKYMGICDISSVLSLFYEFLCTYVKDSFATSFPGYINQLLLLGLFSYKQIKLQKYLSKIEETFSFKRRTLNILSLFKLLLFILKVSHIFACIWLFLGRSNPNSSNSWLSGFENESWAYQYLKAYYFICVTMTTIGFGDIVPKNIVEMVVCIFTMIIACVIFGYTINSIGSIFVDLQKEDVEKKENLFVINRYLNEKSITRELQSTVREYLEYYWTQWSNDHSDKEQQILQQLPEDIKESLLLQANRIILQDCQFLQKNFTLSVIQKAVHLIKEKKLTPNEFIINSQEDVSKTGILFFVEKGEIDICQEFELDSSFTQPSSSDYQFNSVNEVNQYFRIIRSSKERTESDSQSLSAGQLFKPKKSYKRVKTVRQGKYFGEISFFTDQPNKFLARSRGFSKILYIERDKFLEFLKINLFNQDYEAFCQIKDSLLHNDLSLLYSQCYFCRSQDHTDLNCPSIHLNPIRMLTICRYNFSQNILERKPQIRRAVNKQFQCSLINLDRVCLTAHRFQLKNESFIEKNHFSLSDFSDSDYDNSQSSQNEQNEELNTDEDLDQSHLSNIKPSHLNDEQKNLFNITSKILDKNDFQDHSPEDNASIIITPKSTQGQHKMELTSCSVNQFNSNDHTNISPKTQHYNNHRISKEEPLQRRQRDLLRKSQKSLTINSNNNNFLNSPLYKQDKRLSNFQHPKGKITPFVKLKSGTFSQKLIVLNKKEIINSSLTLANQGQYPRKSNHNSIHSCASPQGSIHSVLQRRSQHKQMEGCSQFPLQERHSGKDDNNRQILDNLERSIQNEGHIQLRYQRNQQTQPFQNFLSRDLRIDQPFDQIKIFQNYFPAFNLDKVIQRIRKKRIQETSLSKIMYLSKLNYSKKKSVFKQQSSILVKEQSLFTALREGIKLLSQPQRITVTEASSKKEVTKRDYESTAQIKIQGSTILTKSSNFKKNISPQKSFGCFREKIINSLQDEANFKEEDFNMLSKYSSPCSYPFSLNGLQQQDLDSLEMSPLENSREHSEDKDSSE